MVRFLEISWIANISSMPGPIRNTVAFGSEADRCRRSRPSAFAATWNPPWLVLSAPAIETQSDEKLVQLRERLGHPKLRPGVGIESFLRGIEFVHDQQRLAAFFLEGHRGDGAAVTLLIGPDEARVPCHLVVLAEERHRRC